MRWMKRLAAGVLAAGMALALLTACGSSKNDGVAPPVPTSVPETKNAAETITSKIANQHTQYMYIEYRVVGASGLGEKKYVVADRGMSGGYLGTDDKGFLCNFWWAQPDGEYYEIDNTAKTIKLCVVAENETRPLDVRMMFLWTMNRTLSTNRGTYSCYKAKYNGKEYLAEEKKDTTDTMTYYYESENATVPAYISISFNYEDLDNGQTVMFKIENWNASSSNDAAPEKYRAPSVIDLSTYSTYTGYQARS